jgi:gamma-glutamyltranspeptidase/glutathione hydrolase
VFHTPYNFPFWFAIVVRISTMRTPSSQKSAAIATPHPAAAAAGKAILLRGGNAVDAAVGAMLACCVAMPGSVGLGGYGGSLVAYLAAERKATAVDFDARAPWAYRPETFGGRPEAYETGYPSVTVPAIPAGLDLALQQLGTLPWAVVSEPAIALAEGGVPVSADLHRELENWSKKTDPASLRALFPDGRVPQAGTAWVQPDMARLLRRLAEEGPGAFYHGEIPRQIVRQVQENGGILAEVDFERYRPEVVKPLFVDYQRCRLFTPPPPSGGLTSLQILKMLELCPPEKRQAGSAEYFHWFAEAAKRAWRDRAKYLGDPECTAIPVERLLSEETARAALKAIRHGDVARGEGKASAAPPHTVNILTADSVGNVVSMTATQGALYGSLVVIDGLGLVMGHGMSRFDLAEGSPNAPAAGKRMLHNMAPMVLLGHDGQPSGAVGLPGGRKIVTVTAQLVVNLLDFGLAPAAAIPPPRVHVEDDEPVAVSSAVPDAVIEQLRALGHTVRRGQDTGGPPGEIGGVANALWIDPATGEIAVASHAGEAAAMTIEL